MLEVQRERGHSRLIGELLFELGFVEQETILRTLAEEHGAPFLANIGRIADPVCIDVLRVSSWKNTRSFRCFWFGAC